MIFDIFRKGNRPPTYISHEHNALQMIVYAPIRLLWTPMAEALSPYTLRAVAKNVQKLE